MSDSRGTYGLGTVTVWTYNGELYAFYRHQDEWYTHRERIDERDDDWETGKCPVRTEYAIIGIILNISSDDIDQIDVLTTRGVPGRREFGNWRIVPSEQMVLTVQKFERICEKAELKKLRKENAELRAQNEQLKGEKRAGEKLESEKIKK